MSQTVSRRTDAEIFADYDRRINAARGRRGGLQAKPIKPARDPRWKRAVRFLLDHGPLTSAALGDLMGESSQMASNALCEVRDKLDECCVAYYDPRSRSRRGGRFRIIDRAAARALL